MNIYVRWQKDQPREQRIFSLLDSEVNMPCPLCGEPIGNDGEVQLLAIGPDDEEGRKKHAAGRWYSALALMLHTGCLNGVNTDKVT